MSELSQLDDEDDALELARAIISFAAVFESFKNATDVANTTMSKFIKLSELESDRRKHHSMIRHVAGWLYTHLISWWYERMRPRR